MMINDDFRAGAANDMNLVVKAFVIWLYSLYSDVCTEQKVTWYSRDAFRTVMGRLFCSQRYAEHVAWRIVKPDKK